MSSMHAARMITAERLAQAERSRLARIASCCRPSALASRAHALKARVAQAGRSRSEQTCCA